MAAATQTYKEQREKNITPNIKHKTLHSKN